MRSSTALLRLGRRPARRRLRAVVRGAQGRAAADRFAQVRAVRQVRRHLAERCHAALGERTRCRRWWQRWRR
eukprot:5449994-Prymnesium_polylepis.2